jgi:catechol 2,3-dioxygenase-like lactoylglutathione lyase family enzyme
MVDNPHITTTLEGLTLHVQDVERSRAFYERVPGVVLAAHRPGQFALFQIGGGRLGLLQLPRGGFHVEIAVSDLDGVHRRLVAAGIEPASAPRQRPWGERTFNVTDPDGNVLEFQDEGASNQAWPGSATTSSSGNDS